MFKKICCFLLSALFTGSLTFAQKNSKSPKNLHIYILAGQSNMAGRGEITPELMVLLHPRVYMLDKNLNWQLAKNPVHFDKPGITGVGPGLSFGIEMTKEDSSVNIGLIPCAVGGTSIGKWKPGAYDPVTKTHPYDDTVIRIQKAMEFGTVKGVIWLQGESDATPEGAENYMENLKALVKNIRKLCKNRRLPVAVGELGRFREPFKRFNREVLDHVGGEIRFSSLVTSEGLNHKGDSTHFDSASANELGIRFAFKMKQLQHTMQKRF